METGLFLPRVFAALAIAGAVVTCCGAALANPIPPAYQDFPEAPGGFMSRVGGPLLADDFEPGVGGHVEIVQWWGSAARSNVWQLTLYSNADGDAESPDGAPSIAVVDAQGAQEANGLFFYEAFIWNAGWTLTRRDSYWLGVANLEDGWNWALGDGVPDFTPGTQRWSAVASPNGFAWDPVQPPSNFAFTVWARSVPEPGTLLLVAIGLLGLGLSRRWRGDLRVSPTMGITTRPRQQRTRKERKGREQCQGSEQ